MGYIAVRTKRIPNKYGTDTPCFGLGGLFQQLGFIQATYPGEITVFQQHLVQARQIQKSLEVIKLSGWSGCYQ